MHDGHLTRVEQRLQRRQARMQAEEAVEIDRGFLRTAGSGNGERRPSRVICAFAERDDHVEPVDSAALKNCDKHPPPRVGCGNRARKERRSKPQTHERQPAILQKDASGDHDRYLLWNSGEPRSSATACDGRDALATVSRVADERSPASTRSTISSRAASMDPLPVDTGARTPRTRPSVKATAKFIRFRSAPVLTHASARSA